MHVACCEERTHHKRRVPSRGWLERLGGSGACDGSLGVTHAVSHHGASERDLAPNFVLIEGLKERLGTGNIPLFKRDVRAGDGLQGGVPRRLLRKGKDSFFFWGTMFDGGEGVQEGPARHGQGHAGVRLGVQGDRFLDQRERSHIRCTPRRDAHLALCFGDRVGAVGVEDRGNQEDRHAEERHEDRRRPTLAEPSTLLFDDLCDAFCSFARALRRRSWRR